MPLIEYVVVSRGASTGRNVTYQKRYTTSIIARAHCCHGCTNDRRRPPPPRRPGDSSSPQGKDTLSSLLFFVSFFQLTLTSVVRMRSDRYY